MIIKLRMLNFHALSCLFVFLSARVPFAQDHFLGGEGIVTDPFVITTPQHLSNLRLYTGPSHSDKHFILQNDIDLGVAPWNEGQGWEPIGTYANESTYVAFEGIFNGNNKKILNLFINRDSVQVGLFGYCKGEIRNLGLDSVSTGGTKYVGSLCGGLDSGLIEGCYSSGNVSGNEFVGGLAGWIRKTSRAVNCHSSAVVNGTKWVGGLIGCNERAIVEGCYSTGEVHGSDSYTGGLLGNTYYGTVVKSYSLSQVSGLHKTGGFAGECLHSTIDSCYSAGNVIADGVDNGGFAGGNFDRSIIKNCNSSGMIRAEMNRNTGGFVGNSAADIQNCFSSCVVYGKDSVGGFVGVSFQKIANCYATGNVNGERRVGGMAGYTSGDIEKSYSSGNVQGISEIGGFAGAIEGTMKACYSTGDVTGTVKVGGFLGNGNSSTQNCYSTGNVTATVNSAGGFIGTSPGRVEYCYSTGKVTCPGTIVSGFAYMKPGSRILNYYDSTTTECADTNLLGAPLSTEQMSTKSSFVGWDFDNIWTIDEGTTYPYFRWQGEPGEFNLIPGATNNRKDMVRNSGNEKGILFRGNEIILPYGNCTVTLFSISGTLISSFTASKPGVYNPFRGKRLSNGAYLLSVSGEGRESLRRVVIKK